MNKLHKQTAPFTQVPNELLRDPTLSLKAKGLYALMYSKPDGWMFYESAIVAESRDGKDAVSSAMDELIGAGWIVRKGGREDSTGKFAAYDYEIMATRGGLAVAEKPLRENRCGKPATINTDEVIKKDKKDEYTSATKTGTRITEYFGECTTIPRKWREYATTKHGLSDAECDKRFTEFFNYWSAESGQRARKVNWFATWQNRCATVADWKRGSQSPTSGKARQGGAGGYDKVAAATDRALSELFGVRREGHNGQAVQSTSQADPFGGGATPFDADFVDVGQGDNPSLQVTDRTSGAG